MAGEASRGERAGVTVDTGFDRLEDQLRELRRSLAGDATAPTEPVPDGHVVHDDHVTQVAVTQVASEVTSLEPPQAEPQRPAERTPERMPERTVVEVGSGPARRGLGPDLVLLAAGWSALIVLVVRALGQAA
jgi:hypothetical protein